MNLVTMVGMSITIEIDNIKFQAFFVTLRNHPF